MYKNVLSGEAVTHNMKYSTSRCATHVTWLQVKPAISLTKRPKNTAQHTDETIVAMNVVISAGQMVGEGTKEARGNTESQKKGSR